MINYQMSAINFKCPDFREISDHCELEGELERVLKSSYVENRELAT